MDDMKEGWVTVRGVPTHICTWGGWITEKILPSQEDFSRNNSIILLLSGNPGIIKYYYTFLQTIYKQLAVPIWILSHAGHEQPSKKDNISSLPDNFDLYNVSSQVAHKAEFIQHYVPHDKDIYIISHSFGAKITIELLKLENFRNRIKKCYLLFPTLERIGDTPNGKFIKVIIKHLLTTTIFLTWIFSILPNFLKYWLIKIYFICVGKFNVDPNCIHATIDLINPVILKNVFNLANDEMDEIRELDKEVIEECIDKLRVYFGASDGWAPLEYHYNLIDVVPKVDSTILASKYEHCFVLETAEDLALNLSKQIQCDIDFNKN